MNKNFYFALILFLCSGTALADRIKDLTSVAGVRSNQLLGYGLVVGLAGTGDRDKISFTAQSLKSVLERLGVGVDGPISNYDLYERGVASLAYDKTKLDNVASVVVAANVHHLPSRDKPLTSALQQLGLPPACVAAISF